MVHYEPPESKRNRWNGVVEQLLTSREVIFSRAGAPAAILQSPPLILAEHSHHATLYLHICRGGHNRGHG